MADDRGRFDARLYDRNSLPDQVRWWFVPSRFDGFEAGSQKGGKWFADI